MHGIDDIMSSRDTERQGMLLFNHMWLLIVVFVNEILHRIISVYGLDISLGRNWFSLTYITE